jgi:hypothetical protein
MGNSPHAKRVFVDTSAFIALQDKGDRLHPDAVKFNHYLIENNFDIYTSDYVLDETFTLLKIRAGHTVARTFGQDIRDSKLIKVLNILPNLFDEGWNIFAKAEKEKYSFTDCTSFALMRFHKITKAFSFDIHFQAFGFQKLPEL